MATKKNKTVIALNPARLKGRKYVKWVKKARQFCETTFDENGKQIQRWFS